MERFSSKRSIENFKSVLHHGGVRPTMFTVNITVPQYLRTILATRGRRMQDIDSNLSLLCKSASLPSSVLTSVSVGLPGGAALKLPGSRIVEPWQTTIIMDGELRVREILEEWSSLIIGNAAPRSTMNVENYMSTIFVSQLDRMGDEVRTYKLEYAYPMQIDATPLDYGNRDMISEFGCTWQYHFHDTGSSVIYDGQQPF